MIQNKIDILNGTSYSSVLNFTLNLKHILMTWMGQVTSFRSLWSSCRKCQCQVYKRHKLELVR